MVHPLRSSVLILFSVLMFAWCLWISVTILKIVEPRHRHCRKHRDLKSREGPHHHVIEDLSVPWILPLNDSDPILINAKHLSVQSYVSSAVSPDDQVSFKSWYKKLPTWWSPQSREKARKKKRGTKKTRVIQDYTMLDLLGSGGFGSVRMAVLKADPRKKYVIKRVPKHKISLHRWMKLHRESLDGQKSIRLPMEASILLYIRSLPPSFGQQLIIRLEEYLEDQTYYYLVFEWLPNAIDVTRFFGRSFLDKMAPQQRKKYSLSFIETRRIFFLIARALSFLHDNNIVHGDIKDENVLLYREDRLQIHSKSRKTNVRRFNSFHVKLIDFGSCEHVTPFKPDYHSTPLAHIHEYRGGSKYKSPEILMGQSPYDGFKQDVWSLGILFYFMLYGIFPFQNPAELLHKQISFPSHPFLSYELYDLMASLLHRDPSRRASMRQAISHAFFQNLVENKQ